MDCYFLNGFTSGFSPRFSGSPVEGRGICGCGFGSGCEAGFGFSSLTFDSYVFLPPLSGFG
jgi:hypothetical protein